MPHLLGLMVHHPFDLEAELRRRPHLVLTHGADAKAQEGQSVELGAEFEVPSAPPYGQMHGVEALPFGSECCRELGEAVDGERVGPVHGDLRRLRNRVGFERESEARHLCCLLLLFQGAPDIEFVEAGTHAPRCLQLPPAHEHAHPAETGVFFVAVFMEYGVLASRIQDFEGDVDAGERIDVTTQLEVDA